ncbi:hypothetical protein [Actinoplanes sp. G11-F43]|uniref:hypothetical protein n=1 Tax=Actinoplanes sp. G11-F43 TaxID=3424130 RepID=UPI003D330BA2
MRPAAKAVTLVLLLSAGLAVAALLAASGVTLVEGDSYHTEFAEPSLVAAGFLLAVPVGWVAARHPRAAFAVFLAALIPQTVLAFATMQRAVDAGWADGMTGFALLMPILMIPLFGFVAVIAAVFPRATKPVVPPR